MEERHVMQSPLQLKTITRALLITLALLCFGFSPKAQAVSPPPDGGYANFTTVEAHNALKNLTTGAAYSAVGWLSLFSDTGGSFNTGIGAGTLIFNTLGEEKRRLVLQRFLPTPRAAKHG